MTFHFDIKKATYNNVYKNKRDSSSVKVCSPFVYSCKLKDLCFEIAYFSYTKPLPTRRKKAAIMKMTEKMF